MGRHAGRLGRLQISDNGGSSYSLIGCIIDASMSLSMDELEATCHEDGQDRVYLAGKRDVTVDASYHWDEADAGQGIVEDTAFGTGDGIKVRFMMQEGTGFKQYTADAIITAFNPTSPNDDVADADVAFRLTGPLVVDLQP